MAQRQTNAVRGAPRLVWSRKRVLFNQRNHFGDFTEYVFCGMSAGDLRVVVPNALAIVERLEATKEWRAQLRPFTGSFAG